MNKKVFIVGCGRSGSNWLGRILLSNPKFYGNLEKEPQFSLARKIAIDPKNAKMIHRLVDIYRTEHANHADKVYLDKSHQVIWFAEQIANHFEEAVFVGIQRDLFPSVSSMIKHQGVMNLLASWKDYPIPNPYLGVYSMNEHEIMTPHMRCALFWLSHQIRMKILKETFGSQMIVMHHNLLVNKPFDTASELSQFLGEFIGTNSYYPQDRTLLKWKDHLTNEQIDDIIDVVDRYKARITEYLLKEHAS